MTLLAIDTSTSWASLALFDGRYVLAELTWHAERRHDDELFPSLERLCALAGQDRASIDRVAVAIGPGSFTGLRVAIAAAQGLARGSGAALAGVPTLDVIARPFAQGRVRVCAVLPAGRGEHYAAMYRRRGARGYARGYALRGPYPWGPYPWGRTSAILVGTTADLARAIAVDTIVAGELDVAAEAELRERCGARALFPARAAAPRRAGYLAELGWERFERGEAIEPDALEPLYIRPPAIRGASGELVSGRDLAAAAAPMRPGR